MILLPLAAPECTAIGLRFNRQHVHEFSITVLRLSRQNGGHSDLQREKLVYKLFFIGIVGPWEMPSGAKTVNFFAKSEFFDYKVFGALGPRDPGAQGRWGSGALGHRDPGAQG